MLVENPPSLVDLQANINDSSENTSSSPPLPPIVICPSEIDTVSVTLEKNQQCSCKDCGKLFNSVWYLKQHAVKHSNDRPFKCKFCFKTYKFRSNLYQHKCPTRTQMTGNQSKRIYTRGVGYTEIYTKKIQEEEAALHASKDTSSLVANNMLPPQPNNGMQMYETMSPNQLYPTYDINNGVNQNMMHENYAVPLNSNSYQEHLPPYPDYGNVNQSPNGPAMNGPNNQHLGYDNSYYYGANRMPPTQNSTQSSMQITVNYNMPTPQGHYLGMNGNYHNIHANSYPNHQMSDPNMQYNGGYEVLHDGSMTNHSLTSLNDSQSNRKRKNDNSVSREDHLDQNYIDTYLMRHKDSLLQCDKCHLQFPSKEHYARHLAEHDTMAQLCFACEQCPQRFQLENDLLSHLNLHSDLTVFKCDTCEASFRSNYALRRHKDQCRQCFRHPFGIQPQLMESCAYPIDPYSFIKQEVDHTKMIPSNGITCSILSKDFQSGKTDSGVGSDGSSNSLNSSPSLHANLDEEYDNFNETTVADVMPLENKVIKTLEKEEDLEVDYRTRIDSAPNSCSPSSNGSNGFSPLGKKGSLVSNGGVSSGYSSSGGSNYSPVSSTMEIGIQNQYQPNGVYTHSGYPENWSSIISNDNIFSESFEFNEEAEVFESFDMGSSDILVEPSQKLVFKKYRALRASKDYLMESEPTRFDDQFKFNLSCDYDYRSNDVIELSCLLKNCFLHVVLCDKLQESSQCNLLILSLIEATSKKTV